MSENTTGVDKTCLMHGPGYYSKEFKVLKGYSEKYAAQRSHKDSEACSGSKKKCNNSVEFYSGFKESNIIEHDALIPNKKRKKN